MSMEYVCKTYGVPAKKGRVVTAWVMRGEEWWPVAHGRVVKATAHLILKCGAVIHPTSDVTYYNDDGSVLLDTRKGKEVVK
jgi:hypothetical protein